MSLIVLRNDVDGLQTSWKIATSYSKSLSAILNREGWVSYRHRTLQTQWSFCLDSRALFDLDEAVA